MRAPSSRLHATPSRLARRRERTRLRNRHRRRVVVGLLLLAVLLAALASRLATESVPPYRVVRLLASTIPMRGPRPRLAWPAEGESAVEIPGVGSLGSHGPSRPVPIASVAKVMTAYLTLREHPLEAGSEGFTVTITPAEVEEERSRAALDQSVVPVAAGEKLTERDALEALMLPSANNVAALLAAHDAGSATAFVARMNRAAIRLGMSSTRYTDPSGYEASTVSTPEDLLKLAVAAMREPGFSAIVDERAVRIPVAGRISNYDGLLGHEGYVGIKTGSDTAAGGCLLFAKRVRLDGRRFTVLGAVLGQRDGSLVPAALASARLLGNSAARALREGIVLPAGTRVLRARGADGALVDAVTSKPLRRVGWGGLRVPVTVSVIHRGASSLSPGESVARVRVGDAGASTTRSSSAARSSSSERSSSQGTTRAVAVRRLASPSIGWRFGHLL